MTTRRSLLISDKTFMENTADSNSESDISDSWAVIDQDSCLEWNNEIRLVLGPPQHDFRLPRSSSRNEMSDEDSIEVVAEDHTNDLSDKEVEVVRDEMWPMTDQLDSKGNISTRVSTQDLPHQVLEQKKVNVKWTEYNPILITVLIIGIVGGLALGYICVSQSHKSEGSTSNESTRALITKLQNENHFLRSRLRLARSSMKSSVSKTIPKLKQLTKLDVHNNTKEKSLNVDYSGMCSLTDLIAKAQTTLYDINSKDYCLASDWPKATENVRTTNPDNSSNGVPANGLNNTSLVKKHLETLNTIIVNNYETNEGIAQYDAKQIDQKLKVSSEKASIEPLGGVQVVHNNEAALRAEVIGIETIGTTPENKINVVNGEGRTDPRPYTKLRTTVEKIYALLYIPGNEKQTELPLMLELLGMLPQHLDVLDLSKRNFTTNAQEKITRFKIQLQDATQKLFDDIDASLNTLIQNIAFKIKESQTDNKKQFCNLKTSLLNTRPNDIALLDWLSKPIFQECSIDEHITNDIIMNGGDGSEIKGSLPESTPSQDIVGIKEEFVVRSISPEQEEPDQQLWIERDQDGNYDHKKQNKNLRPTETQNWDLGEKSSLFSHERASKTNKKSYKMEKSIPEDASLIKESAYIEVHRDASTNVKQKSKKVQPDKEMSKKKPKAAKRDKNSSRHSEVHVVNKHEKNGKRKMFGSKEKQYYDESQGKDKKKMKKSNQRMINNNRANSNVSGEWAIKMAHGRAEQRRRDHQSDWVFDRAESRKSSRAKSNKGSYWYDGKDYTGKFLNPDTLRNKTVNFKDCTAKNWKKIKQCMKENLWKRSVDTAKSGKKVFCKFNSKIHYHS